jgi:hypothetical protein
MEIDGRIPRIRHLKFSQCGAQKAAQPSSKASRSEAEGNACDCERLSGKAARERSFASSSHPRRRSLSLVSLIQLLQRIAPLHHLYRDLKNKQKQENQQKPKNKHSQTHHVGRRRAADQRHSAVAGRAAGRQSGTYGQWSSEQCCCHYGAWRERSQRSCGSARCAGWRRDGRRCSAVDAIRVGVAVRR